MRLALAAAALVATWTAGCGGDRREVVEQRSTLAQGEVARVGSESVDGTTVAAIASSQRISVAEARSRAIHDALFAHAAKAQGLDNSAASRAAIRAAQAQALINQVKAEEQSKPITDEEVAKFTAMHWMELDRPESRRVVHAVVIEPPNADAAMRREAEQQASRIASAVADETSPDKFISKAKEVKAGSLKVVAETLPPVAQDGRVVDTARRPGEPEQKFALEFAKAAFRLQRPGEQSPVVHTEFGFHVIMLQSIEPAIVIGLEQRRSMLANEIVASRVRSRLDQVSADLRRTMPVMVERNAESIMELLREDSKTP